MVNIRANTNDLRIDFEGASLHLIEVDPYQRSKKSKPTKPNPVKVSAVMFARQGKTVVELHWNTLQELEISPVSRSIN